MENVLQLRSSMPSLKSRRRATCNDLPTAPDLQRVSSETSIQRLDAMCRLDEMSPITGGGFGRALMKKIKRMRQWNKDGHSKVVEKEVPIDVSIQRSASCPDIRKHKQLSVARSGFHRLVYQKARHLREEHGSGYTGFRQAAEDMVHSVRVCMHATQIGRNLKKAVLEPMHDEGSENDVEGPRNGADNDDGLPKRDSIAKLTKQDDEENDADDGWKNLMADLSLSPRTPHNQSFEAELEGVTEEGDTEDVSFEAELEGVTEEGDTEDGM